MLRVKNVSKSINHRIVVRDVNLELDEGEVIGIFGPNGSGKSTLLKIIAGIIKPDCGRIVFGDTDITFLDVEEVVEKGICYAFQIPRPFREMNVFENVMVGCLLRYSRKEAKKRTEEILRKLGMMHLSERRASQLSQGELKLMEIAKALATEPAVLLLDEPFAALDMKNALAVRDKVMELKRDGYAMIITAHRMRILREIADTFAEMRGGRLHAKG